MPEPHLRAADADGAAVATILGQHMSAGRLTVEEYDERLARVYAAKTYGELDKLTADLPGTLPSPRRIDGPAARRLGHRPAVLAVVGDHVPDRAGHLGRDVAGELGVPVLLARLGH